MAKPNSTKDFYVYVHRKATTGQVFYVGKGHGKRAFSSLSRNRQWKFIVAKHGYTVEMVQNNLQEWYAFELEKELIAYYCRENLCNLTDGGEGQSNPSEATRKKMRDNNAMKNLAYREKISVSNSGKKRTEETKKKLSDAHKGKKQSEETKQKRAMKLKGKTRPQHVIDALVKARSVAVKCSNGLIFTSCTDASRWLIANGNCLSRASFVSRAASGKRKAYAGYEWEYL